MITGAHVLLYSNDPEADRAFFRDVLGFLSVDAGHGWLIFKLPPAEAALHPTDGDPAQVHAGHAMLGAELYLMCDDLHASIQSLAARNVVARRSTRRLGGSRPRFVCRAAARSGCINPHIRPRLGFEADTGAPRARPTGGNW